MYPARPGSSIPTTPPIRWPAEPRPRTPAAGLTTTSRRSVSPSPPGHPAPHTPAYPRARRAAAADARRRADDYVQALGLAVAGIAWVAEPGLRVGVVPDHSRELRPMAAAGLAVSPQGEPVIDV